VKIPQLLDRETGTPIRDCEHCIGGYRPLYLDPVVGAVFDICPHCVQPCSHCRGDAVWTDACCRKHLNQRLYAQHRLMVLACPNCKGIVDVYDYETGTFRP
jgi:hypothetical protein